MLKSQFDYLCENFGDPSIDIGDRWKAIKYIFIENPLMDVQFLLKRNEIMYVDNINIGPGFYILGTPNADIEPINKGSVITFIPLHMIDKITFITNYIETEKVSNITKPHYHKNSPIVEGISFNTDNEDFSTIIE